MKMNERRHHVTWLTLNLRHWLDWIINQVQDLTGCLLQKQVRSCQTRDTD